MKESSGANTGMRLVPIDGVELEVRDQGAGEPVVFVQTALTADELRPLADAALQRGFRGVLYRRRGYGRSTPASGPGSIARDAGDCRALLAALGIRRAHVVGLSYSGAVAMELAAGAPDLVHTLTLIEPPPVQTPSSSEFRAANDRLLRTRRELGAENAVREFMTLLEGPLWLESTERHLPGSAAQMLRDGGTFFDTDMPALLAWSFGESEARRIGCPALYVGGTESGPWFAEVHQLMTRWLPQAEDLLIAGAGHSLALTHTRRLADALTAFVQRHPM